MNLSSLVRKITLYGDNEEAVRRTYRKIVPGVSGGSHVTEEWDGVGLIEVEDKFTHQLLDSMAGRWTLTVEYDSDKDEVK